MDNDIQKEIQERREHTGRLKKIALKLFEQLKSEKVDFSDAERIISMGHSSQDPADAHRAATQSAICCLHKQVPDCAEFYFHHS